MTSKYKINSLLELEINILYLLIVKLTGDINMILNYPNTPALRKENCRMTCFVENKKFKYHYLIAESDQKLF